MIEKVLRGFYEEDIESEPNWFKYTISKDKLVSVRLVSKSVDLKWLKKEINATKLEFSQGHKNAEGNINSATSVNAIFALERLKDRIWAEKEAKK